MRQSLVGLPAGSSAISILMFRSKKVPVEYLNTINWLAEKGLVGGITYDALIAKVAQKSRVEKLVTMNVDDLLRVWPEGEDVIVAP